MLRYLSNLVSRSLWDGIEPLQQPLKAQMIRMLMAKQGYDADLYAKLDAIGGRSYTNKMVQAYSPGGPFFWDWMIKARSGQDPTV